jgi:enoyl-CoA hydratase
MSASDVILEQRDAVAILSLDRPPANAVCLELAQELSAALDSRVVQAAGALVLTGAGRFFSGGLDLKAVPGYSREQQREFLDLLNRLLGRLYALRKPVVGAINGHAVAGGLILALASDYRVGSTGEVQLGLTEARVGIPFPAVPMIILRAECAPQDVRYSALRAHTFGPEEARRRGVLDELVAPHAVLDRAIEVAREMAGMPADSYARIKQQVRASALAEIEEVVSRGSDPMLSQWLSPQAREASAAVLASSRRR